MKTVKWILIGCRILAVSFGLTLLISGCGDSGSKPSVGGTEEEVKRNADTQNAMEDASQAAKKR